MNNIPEISIVGHTDKISVAPGESIQFFVSELSNHKSYETQLVRLKSADTHPEGCGLIEEPIPASINGRYVARKQPCYPGSHVHIGHADKFGALESVTISAIIFPTAINAGPQCILGNWVESEQCGFCIILNENGTLSLKFKNHEHIEEIRTRRSLCQRSWSHIIAIVDTHTGSARLIQHSIKRQLGDLYNDDVTQEFEVKPIGGNALRGGPFLLGATSVSPTEPMNTINGYNGKLEAPQVFDTVLCQNDIDRLLSDQSFELSIQSFASWDFSIDIHKRRIMDTSANGLDGECMQLPTRGVTSHRWTGQYTSWKEAPDHYAAIALHDDDLYETGWDKDFEYTIPVDLPSGIYAAKLENGNEPSHIVFFVRPPRSHATSDIAFIASTANYLAYANYQMLRRRPGSEATRGRLWMVGPEDLTMFAHPEFGLSAYDSHTDGSGVKYSSFMRPILNLGPNTRLSSFSGDAYATAWLNNEGFEPDIISDHDIHADGEELLNRYRVLVTGCHPEYWSTPMIAALKNFMDNGGRLMYLGGNGFYWRIAFTDEWPAAIEIRRGVGGTGPWQSAPGEHHLAFTGEQGGLWRNNGCPTNELVGVGFAAQGFDLSSYYRRQPGADSPRAAFIMEEVEDDIIGDFGCAFGGAAGQELDRYDEKLGSPPHALILASSEGHTDHMLMSIEDCLGTSLSAGGNENPLVRADMVFYETPAGGAVFSTGSISWCSSLPINNFDNNVAKISTNVLRRFIDPEAFTLNEENNND